MKRQRALDRQHAEGPAEEPPCNTKTYYSSDFEYMRDRLNADLDGSTELASCDTRLKKEDTRLRVVNMSHIQSDWCVPLICPALIHRVLSKLPQPYNIKLSGDGTYRLMMENAVLITVGVNVKHWGCSMERTKDDLYAFRSKFVPLAFALASTESESAYSRLVGSLLIVAQQLGHTFGAWSILQWHGDMHKGLEAARRATAPSSTRLSDWAHVLGQTSEGPPECQGSQPSTSGPV